MPVAGPEDASVVLEVSADAMVAWVDSLACKEADKRAWAVAH